MTTACIRTTIYVHMTIVSSTRRIDTINIHQVSIAIARKRSHPFIMKRDTRFRAQTGITITNASPCSTAFS